MFVVSALSLSALFQQWPLVWIWGYWNGNGMRQLLRVRSMKMNIDWSLCTFAKGMICLQKISIGMPKWYCMVNSCDMFCSEKGTTHHARLTNTYYNDLQLPCRSWLSFTLEERLQARGDFGPMMSHEWSNPTRNIPRTFGNPKGTISIHSIMGSVLYWWWHVHFAPQSHQTWWRFFMVAQVCCR